MTNRYIIALLLSLSVSSAYGQIPTFPGAQGGGAEAEGGRGGAVMLVTNTANSGTGSLRACIDASGPRTCIFRTGGTIEWTGDSVVNPFLTIAGQTAPGGGIMLRAPTTNLAAMLYVNASDVVIRYIRFRKGRFAGCMDECGANIIVSRGNVVIDHVSGSWNEDEGFGGVGFGQVINGVTYSYNLVAEPLAVHPTAIGFGGNASANSNIITNIDYHHNMVANSNHRNPLLRIKSARWINNIVYNVRRVGMSASEGITIDVIGNVYKQGPHNTVGGGPEFREIGAGTGGSGGKGAPGNPSVFVLGNKGWHQSNPDGDQTPLLGQSSSENGTFQPPFPAAWRRFTRMADTAHPITVEHANDINNSILPIVGASRRLDCDGNWVSNRDAVDARIINEYNTGTGPSTFHATEAGYGGYPTVAAGTPCEDSDLDGMPNAWESARPGLSNSDASDRNGDLDGDGFTNLEEYLAGPQAGSPPPPPPPPPP